MKHQNTFVTIVGIAAWVHSTWSFSTVIGGEVPLIASWVDIPRWLYWILPGAAAAAAVDVGLISLAAQFRLGKGARPKLVTFAVLSFISYLGQALFSLSHGGQYIPSTGLSSASVAIASVVWELLIWLLPAALPVTLILWAWSDMTPTKHEPDAPNNPEPLIISQPETVELQLAAVEQAQIPAEITLTCEYCQKSYSKPTLENAQRALSMHQNRHCTAIPRQRSYADVVTAGK